jgi:alkylated DNA nucleotide flippase Atl1
VTGYCRLSRSRPVWRGRSSGKRIAPCRFGSSRRPRTVGGRMPRLSQLRQGSVYRYVGSTGRSTSRRAAHGEAASAGRDQASGLVCREVTGRGGLDVTLEVANRGAGPSPENAVHRPFVITQTTQRFLDLPPV